MTRTLATWMAAAAAIAAAGPLAGAQTVAERVTALGSGTLQARYASRPGACGDGSHFFDAGLGGANHHEGWDGGRACEPGPVRIVATVVDGHVTRVRSYIGPDRGTPADVDLGRISTGEAARFLTSLVQGPEPTAAQGAIDALVLADSTEPWPTLLRVARAPSTPRRVARSAAFWLGQGAAVKAGVADAEESSTDDEMRAQAVFALSQQPHESSIPQLLDVARRSPHAVARSRALFWLGQSGDPRALDLFAEILGIR